MANKENAPPTALSVAEGAEKKAVDGHPDDFEVSGPRNLTVPSWKEMIRSSWRSDHYKRTVMACFVQAVYLIELDRQEKREDDAALAPPWWRPFKYRLADVLTDSKDKSVYGAVFEWDSSAAFSNFIVVRPRKAPRAVIALRGTLLRSQTMRRDIQDDLRLLTTENLTGSCRFKGALEALKTAVERYGSTNVCMAGHSLGAGLALQIGKLLAEQGIFIETHLFNPPSVSLPMGMRSVVHTFQFLWRATKRAVYSAVTTKGTEGAKVVGVLEEHNRNEEIARIQEMQQQQWVPHLYVNERDYICCHYSDDSTAEQTEQKPANGAAGRVAAKLFVMSKGPTKFMEAHGIQQWWTHDDSHLHTALHAGRLLQRQLSSIAAPR